jgi:hypothetical protein
MQRHVAPNFGSGQYHHQANTRQGNQYQQRQVQFQTMAGNVQQGQVGKLLNHTRNLLLLLLFPVE